MNILNNKIIAKSNWLIDASLELYKSISIGFEKLTKVEIKNLPRDIIIPLNSSYKMAKTLFLEGRKQYEIIKSCGIITVIDVDVLNKRYFVRSERYLANVYNFTMNLYPFTNNKSKLNDIKNDIKILLMQNKSIVETLCLIR